MNEWKWTESIFDFAPNYTCSFLRNMKSLLITEMVNRSIQILNSPINLQKKNICQGLWGGQIKVTKHLFACSHNFQEKKTQQNQTKLLFASINNWELYVAPDCFYMREESGFLCARMLLKIKSASAKKVNLSEEFFICGTLSGRYFSIPSIRQDRLLDVLWLQSFLQLTAIPWK